MNNKELIHKYGCLQIWAEEVANQCKILQEDVENGDDYNYHINNIKDLLDTCNSIESSEYDYDRIRHLKDLIIIMQAMEEEC